MAKVFLRKHTPRAAILPAACSQHGAHRLLHHLNPPIVLPRTAILIISPAILIIFLIIDVNPPRHYCGEGDSCLSVKGIS